MLFNLALLATLTVVLGSRPCTHAAGVPVCSVKLGSNTITGHATPNGACRYTLRYGQADRWSDSVSAKDLGWVPLPSTQGEQERVGW
jgi:hypothetical protein